MRIAWISLLFVFLFGGVSGQKVGLVLSGGGAAAMAHVGILKVLEEKGIPIDYIAGTSMGAIVGGMYVSGYSPEEIEEFVRSDEFQRMASGELEDRFRFYFKQPEPDASLVTLKFFKGSFISNTLPTNLIDPQLFDYKLMSVFSQASAKAEENFDNLFVPFRCVASDIENKREVIFRGGSLSQAVRASSTYPFYIPPIRIDGSLLYDGGLYNNFPSNILYYDFLPDVIIGCNVSENSDPPDVDNLFSQLESMISYKTNFESLCDHMIIIEPQTEDIGTFGFERVAEAMLRGEVEALKRMEEIEAVVERRVPKEEVELARKEFNESLSPLIFDQISMTGLEKTQKSYVRNILGRDLDTISNEKLKEAYFRIFNDDKIKSIYPTARFNPTSGFYNLELDIKKEKDIMVSFGGNFSSRSINTGFIGLRYNLFDRVSSTLSANSYFGKFYGSVRLGAKFDFPAKQPFSLEPHMVLNRWDYFKSLATFFEDVKPSFIVKNERYGGVNMRMPAGNRGRFGLDVRYAHLFDDYYQTQNFLSTDTADQTNFHAFTTGVHFERNTLNHKSFPNKGTKLKISGRIVQGEEETIPGSTSAIRDTSIKMHDWYTARLTYTNYFGRLGSVKFGFSLDGVVSSQTFFSNHISTIIQAQSFEPIPESRTLFQQQYRAHNFAGGGLIGVWSIKKNLDLRVEGYVFQPIERILADSENKPFYDRDLTQFYIGSGSAIYHTPLGPISVSANYYDKEETPWSFLFNFGYLIFNPKALD